MDKLDKIIELLEAIKANQEVNQYYYHPPIFYWPNFPQPDPIPSYPQPNWTTSPFNAGGNKYQS